ncbi:slo-interacting protein 1 isoform X3 [Drosophila nasuta]|uniref:slo-interacting protein 1 isoform X3 n=1 Tax=Drosophila nasuta TaxID=42062 RepID=UPI00295F4489|nr:slo-interacting protein 1 isoform X3 [Drosophila nasuta]
MCSNNCVSVVDLDYVLIKLNGSDISSLSSYEVVQMFLQSKENLVVELSRKTNHLQFSDAEQNKFDIYTKHENILQLPKDTRDGSQPNTNSISFPLPQKNEIILTLRAFNNVNVDAEPLLTDVEHATVVSKGTQTTTENGFDIKQNIDHNKDIVQSIADHFIEQQHHLFEQCLEPEIDIEEITLINKDSIGGNLGLSVSCPNDFEESIKPVIRNDNSNNTDLTILDEHDACEDVFISDIQSESIADIDGRLRRGDQILRINGLDIKTKKHAESQISMNGKAVTLLVSRILYPGEDEDDDDDDDDIDSNFEYANRLLPDDYTNVVDKLDTILLAQQQQSVLTGNNLITTQTNCKSARVNPDDLKNETQISTLSLRDEEPTKLPKLHLKSKLQSDCPCQLSEKNLSARSGDKASKTAKYGYDESEHIYETIPEDSESEPLYCSPYQSSNYMTAMGSCSSADVLEMQQQTQRVAQWLGLKKIGSRSIHTLSGRLTKQQNRLPNRICTLTNTTSGSSSSGAAYSACGYINIDSDHANQNLLVNQNKEEIDTSSSAYNTGGSNNSASPRQNGPIANLNNENSTSFQIISGALKNTASTIEPFGKCSRIHCPAHVSQKEQIDEPHTGPLSAKADVKVSRLQPTEEQQVQSCPQFNAPNLSRYHFVSSQEVSSKIVSGVSKPNAILVHTENVSEEIPMVWKVKRRPDGTRYIVKRPVRNHLHLGIRKNLRNGDLTTTEDDTISEVKIGRYWTKEERKRHIERARERRHHQQLINQPQYPT